MVDKNISDSQYSHAVLCASCFSDGKEWRLYVGHGIVILVLASALVLLAKFAAKRNLFPIKERAPLLAIIQAFSFAMLVSIPYLTEILIDVGARWGASATSEDVPILRGILKAFYMCMRVLCYVVFLFR